MITKSFIPTWRTPAYEATTHSPSSISTTASLSTAVPSISDGSDNTSVLANGRNGKNSAVYSIDKDVLKNQILQVVPDNAQDIVIRIVARCSVVSGDNTNYIIVSNNDTITSASMGKTVTLHGLHRRLFKRNMALDNYDVLTVNAQNKSGISEYFANLSYADISLLQYGGATSSSYNITLYDVWVEVTYNVLKVKIDGEWTGGDIKAKVNGEWVTPDAISIKVDGGWIDITR